MSEGHRARYVEEFKKADKDGSGKISKAELQAVLNDMGKELVDLDKMFARVDQDNSGQIDMKEFLIFMEDVDNAWVRIQKKTFTRWANTVLSNKMLKLDDICYDLRNGVLLKALIEILVSKELPKINKNPRMRLQNMENLNKSLDFLKSDGVKLVNIGADDLADGNERITLGLIWTLILKYQIGDSLQSGSPKYELLEWVKKQIAPYNTGVKLKNFKNGWSDGKVLSALTDSLGDDFKGTIDTDNLNEDPYEASKIALDTAENKYEIPKILDAADLVENPDEHSIMTYVSYFRDWADSQKTKPSAQNTTAEGPGVEGGAIQDVAPFTVRVANKQGTPLTAGGFPVSALVHGPDGNTIPCEVTDNNDGTFSGSYSTPVPGDYVVDIKLKNEDIKGNTFSVHHEAANPSKSYAEGNGLVEAKTARPAEFTIFPVGADGNRVSRGGDAFEVTITGPNGPVIVELVDAGDGTYPVRYSPADAGPHTIAITLYGENLEGSPYTATVKQAVNSAKSYVSGPGLKRAYDNKPAHFTVHAIDDLGEPVQAEVCDVKIVSKDGGEPITDITTTDNKDGTWKVDYAPTKAGNYEIQVQLEGQDVQGTPVPIKVRVGADASKTGAAKFSVTIVAVDKDGNSKTEGGDDWECDITSVDGVDVPTKTKDNGDGTYTVNYSLAASSPPTEYAVSMKLGGDEISGSPFKQFM